MAILRIMVSIVVCLVVLDSTRAQAVSLGDPLPAIRLAGLDGSEVEVRSDEGQVVVIEFWATWCLPCRTTLPAVASVATRHADTVHVYAITIDRDAGDAKDFLRAYLPEIPPSVTVLHDPGGALLASFGAAGMPALYAAEEGVVGFVEGGAKPDLVDRLRQFLESHATPRP